MRAATEKTITKPTGPRRASRVTAAKGNQQGLCHESVISSKSKEVNGALGTLATTIQPTTLVVLKPDDEGMRAQI